MHPPRSRTRWAGLLPCVATTPVAGVLGAAVDERLHQSLGLWFALCRRGRLPYLEALWLQLQLMPFALIFMLVTAFAGTLWAVLRSGTPASARMLLAGHAGCLVATLMSPLVCPWLVGGALAGSGAAARPTPSLALAGMLASELLLTVAVAWAVLALATGRPDHARMARRATGS